MKIEIFFGEVVKVDDDQKLNRIKVKIPGKTDKLDIDGLPWYFPFLGMDQVPVNGDKIPIIIFENNFVNGFYLKKLVDSNNSQSALDGTEYENYLEIYKRNGVELTYKESSGIEFINTDNAKLQLLTDEFNAFIGDNQFLMTEDRFDLGTDGEATPLGDKTVDVLLKQLALSKKLYNNCMALFNAIAGASTNPYTLPIKIALSAMIPIKTAEPITDETTLEQKINQIQSEKTFIE